MSEILTDSLEGMTRGERRRLRHGLLGEVRRLQAEKERLLKKNKLLLRRKGKLSEATAQIQSEIIDERGADPRE